MFTSNTGREQRENGNMSATTTTETAECVCCGKWAELNRVETCRVCHDEISDWNAANDWNDGEGAADWQAA